MNVLTAMYNHTSITMAPKRKQPHISIAAIHSSISGLWIPIFSVHTDEFLHVHPDASILSTISMVFGRMMKEWPQQHTSCETKTLSWPLLEEVQLLLRTEQENCLDVQMIWQIIHPVIQNSLHCARWWDVPHHHFFHSPHLYTNLQFLHVLQNLTSDSRNRMSHNTETNKMLKCNKFKITHECIQHSLFVALSPTTNKYLKKEKPSQKYDLWRGQKRNRNSTRGGWLLLLSGGM